MNNSAQKALNKSLAEIEAERNENLARLKELLKNCEMRISTTDDRIKEQQGLRATQVAELNRIRELIAKHE